MEPLIRIEDIAFVCFAAPDLDEMRRFLVEFGLSTAEQDGRLYGAGRDGAPYAHVTEPGEAAFRALGLRAASVADVHRVAAHDGVAVTSLDAPGGGVVARLTDPDGIAVELVAGQSWGERTATAPEPVRNSAALRGRLRKPVRVDAGPSTVLRLGHCVLNVSDFMRSEAWYKQRFGFITSDEIEVAPGHAIGAFLRCDRGEQPTDHHTLFLAPSGGEPGFNHAAFEVAGLDDLMVGHAHLHANGRHQSWGVGRHKLGSQIFDYWRDPWGHELEHWTDGDLFTAADGSNKATLPDLLGVQWGQPHPMMRPRTEGIKA